MGHHALLSTAVSEQSLLTEFAEVHLRYFLSFLLLAVSFWLSPLITHHFSYLLRLPEAEPVEARRLNKKTWQLHLAYQVFFHNSRGA